MEESPTSTRDERRKTILGRFNVIDVQEPSPSERAKYLYDKLNALEPKPTHWDLVCFCAETLGMLTIELPALNTEAASLLRMIYELHYYGDDVNPSCLPQRQQQQNQNSTTSPTNKTTNSSDQTGASPLSDLVIEKSQSVVLELKDY